MFKEINPHRPEAYLVNETAEEQFKLLAMKR